MIAAASLSLAVLYVAPASAVHDVGVFELDGNGATQNAANTLPDDWDRICQTVTSGGVAGCGTTVAAHGATGATFDNDGLPTGAQTIYTGGSTKDDLDLDGWLWKDGGGLPDKDNLVHAMASRYTCVAVSGCTGTAGDKYLYFGADRFDNSGDSQIGFWFLQGDVGTVTGKKNSFGPDKHQIGDILVLSDFTNGGASTTIRIFKWDPAHTPASELVNNTLLPIGGGTINDATCGVAAHDDFCALVNTGDGVPSPWPFLDKSGHTTFGHGEFYEGGINLSKLPGNIANECFASFISETRSSQSVDAVLKDFVLGGFQACEAGIVTTPSASTIALGSSIHDSAVVTGQGGGTPTGKVKFFVCTAAQLNASGQCETGGTQLIKATSDNTGEPLVADPNDATKANASSADYTPAAAGHYCFRGDYVPAAGSFYSADSDFATTECFDVTQSSIVTTPSSASIHKGDSIHDSAVVTGQGGGTPTGKVKFFVCTAAQLNASGQCETGGTQLIKATSDNTGEPLVADPNNATKANASSADYTPAAAGHYCFRGEYVPAAGSLYPSAKDFATTECFDVTESSIVTTPSTTTVVLGNSTSVTDGAVVTGLGGGTPTGKVKFFVCTAAQLNASGQCETGGTQLIKATSDNTGEPLVADPNDATKANASSSGYTPTAVGRYCFRGEYVPAAGSTYASAKDFATTECFDVTDTSSAATKQNWLPNDSASISSAGGTALSGSTVFTLYDNGTCTPGTNNVNVLYTSSPIPVSGTSPQVVSTSNTTVKVTVLNSTAFPRTVSWKAVYTSDASTKTSGSTSTCETSTITITD